MYALRLERKGLWTQLAIAALYGLPLLYFGSLTGRAVVDGVLGGMLGLYVCSLPARQAIDVLFADRFALRRIWSTRSGAGWLALNGLVLLVGWLVILLGMIQLIRA
jgi:hypothetical protein